MSDRILEVQRDGGASRQTWMGKNLGLKQMLYIPRRYQDKISALSDSAEASESFRSIVSTTCHEHIHISFKVVFSCTYTQQSFSKVLFQNSFIKEHEVVRIRRLRSVAGLRRKGSGSRYASGVYEC